LEPWFVFALFLATSWLRLYKLGDIPPVAGGNEGLILGNCAVLINKGAPYMPHIGGGTDWPTFTYYVGIIFAKILGWDIANFRISSAIFGIISVISLYFLIRRLTSPLAAAISSIMYTVFLTHLITSRFFVPVASLLFIPHIICLAILLTAIKKPDWRLYLAAGLACGYSLQGYFPGRGVILLFLGWFLWMFITRQKLFHKPSNFFIFLGGFVLVASPVIYFAIVHPDGYWNYVQSVNPNNNGGLISYFKMIISRIPLYTGMFYRQSACEVFWHLPYKPLFDPVVSVLFSSGLFLSFFAFWKPVPSALLILFLGSMIPGLLGGGSSVQPNSIRALMAFPLIFIFCAYSFERIKRIFYGTGRKWLYLAVIAAGVISSIWSFQNGIREFFKWSVNPGLLINEHHELYLAGINIKKHPDAVLFETPLFSAADAAGVYIPMGKKVNIKKTIDEMLVFPDYSDYLICLDPFYTDLTGIFKTNFPDAVIDVYREDKNRENDPYYTSMKLNQGYKRQVDKYAPFIFLSTVYIPKQDVIDFQTMLYTGIPGDTHRVRVFGGSDFAGKYSGKKISLRGAFIIADTAVNDLNNKQPAIFSIAWKGWTLMVDGIPRNFGGKIQADGGIHFFQVSGVVPAGSKGDIPLMLLQGNVNLGLKGQIAAVDGKFGTHVYHTPGANNWDKPYTYSYRLPGPNLKMYDGMSMPLPFSLREESFMNVPVDGDYLITGNSENRSKIIIDGTIVFDNMADPLNAATKSVKLYSGHPVKIVVLQTVEGIPSGQRAVTILVKGPGMENPVLAPYEWFYPDD
jgi:4-amino-4-deoxy-L-arabinose transferase-like glycosyltransferase